MNQSRDAIRVESVHRRFQTGRRVISALSGVSLTISEGEWVAIVGPSGCGKSTLLNVISGIDAPDEGRVVVAGRSLNSMSENALASWRGREVGIVFQFFQLMPTLTVLENVLLPMDLAGRVGDRRSRARRLLQDVDVAELSDHLPSELSGGEQQRVAIARALANSPGIVLADEPTGNLDSRNGRIVVDLLEHVWQRGTTIVMVTHDLELSSRASRVIAMRDGRIEATFSEGEEQLERLAIGD
jgi:putative ABC transport system ATP-binding protein